MSLYASVSFDPGVLPDQVEADGVTHAATYDLGGQEGDTWSVHLKSDGTLLVDGEEMHGDFGFEFFVMNRHRAFDMQADYADGKLTDLYVAREHLSDEEVKQGRTGGLLDRIVTTFNSVIARLRSPT